MRNALTIYTAILAFAKKVFFFYCVSVQFVQTTLRARLDNKRRAFLLCLPCFRQHLLYFSISQCGSGVLLSRHFCCNRIKITLNIVGWIFFRKILEIV